MKKRILVTGATGFIGQHIIPLLLENGCQVTGTSVDEQKARNFPWFQKITYKAFNLEQFDPSIDYCLFFDKPDMVIHLAWEGLPNYTSLFHFETSLPRQYGFVKNLIINGLKDISIAGTCLEYGMQEGSLEESMPAFPANSYALAKNTLYKFLTEVQKKHPFSLKWIRLFYMYGKGQNPNSLFSQLEKAIANGENVFNMSGGEQVRDFLPIEKVAEYIVKIACQNDITGIVNCCSGEPVTVKKIVGDYLEKQNKSVKLIFGHYPYPDYEPMSFWGDNTKLKTIINNE